MVYFKNIFLSFIISFILSTVVLRKSSAGSPAGQGSREPNVVILTIAGIRNSETIDDPFRQYMPGLLNVLVKKGFMYKNLIERNYEIHMQSVEAINSGKNYVGDFECDQPTLFQYLIMQKRWPREKLWSISQWYNFNAVYDTGGPGPETFPCMVSFRFEYSAPAGLLNKHELFNRDAEYEIAAANPLVHIWPHWQPRSRVLHDLAIRVLSEYKPKFIHYVLNMTETAHYESYAVYIQSIRETDEQIMDIWEIVTTDPFYKGNTYLFITADHQRDAYHMNHTESLFVPDRNVWLYIFGPGVKENDSSEEPVYHIDVFKTISEIYDLKTHPTDGKFLRAAFEEDILKEHVPEDGAR